MVRQVLGLLLLFGRSVAAGVVFVDCGDSGSGGDGSRSSPFGSLGEASAAVRASGGGVVEVAEGSPCYLDSPLVPPSHTTWRSASEGSPPKPGRGGALISGGARLPKFVAADGGLVVADATGWPRGITSLRVGGERRERSRYPQRAADDDYGTGWLFAKEPARRPGPRSDAYGGPASCVWCNGTMCPGRTPALATPTCLVGAPDVPAGLGVDDAVANVFGTGEADVLNQLVPLVSRAQDVLELPLERGIHLNQRFWLENVDDVGVGQFYYKASSSQLFYSPTNDDERRGLLDGSLAAIAPKLATTVELRGVANVSLEGLSFSDTSYFAVGTWTGPAAEPSDGAVRINDSTDVRVSRCSFLPGLSGYGVVVGNASRRVEVTRSSFQGLGQGGVLFYGVQDETRLNRPPSRGNVSWNTFRDLGKTLKHVAAVGLRSGSDTYVGHNRISRVPRYAIQADTFYNLSIPGGRRSTNNTFEYNVIDLSSAETTDTGAFELLGSQDPSLVDFDLGNTIRYNKVTRTLGASSSDGVHVCQGDAASAAKGCRGLAWSIYLDGAYSGAHVHHNILDGSSHGGIIINGGGNVVFENNLVYDAKTTSATLSTCWSPAHADRVRWPANTFVNNIFYLTKSGSTVYGLPGPPNTPECTFLPSRLVSDANIFYSPNTNLTAVPLFPSEWTLDQWQAGNVTRGAGGVPPFPWTGFDAASAVVDPRLVDVPNGVLDPASPAYDLGFTAFPDIEGAAPPFPDAA